MLGSTLFRSVSMDLSATKKLFFGMALMLMLTANNAQAALILIDFEGVGNLSSILNFYNGGTDSGGKVGANNYGVQFSNTSLGLIDLDAGGTGDFANEPSASTVLFINGGKATMSVAAGFTSLSFFYTARPIGPLGTIPFVEAYSDIGGSDGTGSLLSNTLIPTPTAVEHEQRDCLGDLAGVDLCFWVPVTVNFDGIAKSIDFGGEARSVVFDNIAIETIAPSVSQVPIPTAAWLMGSGIMGLLLNIKRKAPKTGFVS
jgi:hypothetical protein